MMKIQRDTINRVSLSIIIPSCNRHAYLLKVLGKVLTETSAEIVVSDNSDVPLASEALEGLSHEGRLIYRHHAENLSVVENFERALNMASGQYLIFIGDDDCIGPGLEEIAQWASEEGIDAVVSYRERFIANYYWPGVTSKYFGDGYAGKMFVAQCTGGSFKFNSRAAMCIAASRPGSGLGSMVRAYHGLISRTLINRVVSKYGHLFGGVSPDIYSATLLSYEAKNPYIVDFPFVIPGASPSSTAGEGAAKQDVDTLKNRDHIKRFGEKLEWDPRIPAFYSPITVWAYSQSAAIKLLKDKSIIFNFPSLYLRCFFYYWSYRAEIARSIHCWELDSSVFFILVCCAKAIYAEVSDLFSRAWYKFILPPVSHSGLNTICDGFDLLKNQYVWHRPPSLSRQVQKPRNSDHIC
jgi:glycosyltransferase involved in cell wall biosynthesis